MSTTVIIEGDESLLTRDRRFICPFCGAIFISDSYDLATLGEDGALGTIAYLSVQESPGISATATCPTCGRAAVSPSGSGGEVQAPVALVVKSLPAKTAYQPGDYFDPEGLVLGMVMTDGSIGTVALTDCTFDPDTETALTTADTAVTVTHTPTTLELTLNIAVRNSATARPYVTGPTEFVYSGSQQGPTIVYFNSATMTKENDKKTSAGNYTLTITPKTGYMWPDGSTEALEFPWVIKKAVPVVTAPTPIANLVYTGEAQDIIVPGSTSGGTMYYKLNAGPWETTPPTATYAATHTVTWKVDGGTNYESDGPHTLQVTIAKADPTVIAPVGKENLVYTGEEQTMLTTSPQSGGALWYRYGNGTWSTTVPKATDAGSYDIEWKFVGDSNHNDKPGSTITVAIAKGQPVVTATPSTITLTAVDATATIAVDPGISDDRAFHTSAVPQAICTIASDPETDHGLIVTAKGNGSVEMTITADETSNCLGATATVTITVSIA